MSDEHYRALEGMYLSAPINTFYRPTITITEAAAEIEMDVDAAFFHAAGAVHGSVYFKMLDDAAFFAASSLETEVFVLTTTFTTYLTRPVSAGRLRAVGKVVNRNRSQLIAEAVVYDGEGREIGRGNGIFVRSKRRLRDVESYGPPSRAGNYSSGSRVMHTTHGRGASPSLPEGKLLPTGTVRVWRIS